MRGCEEVVMHWVARHWWLATSAVNRRLPHWRASRQWHTVAMLCDPGGVEECSHGWSAGRVFADKRNPWNECVLFIFCPGMGRGRLSLGDDVDRAA